MSQAAKSQGPGSSSAGQDGRRSGELLKIPTATEDLKSFLSRAGALLLHSKSHVFLDTSFLMWLTKIGKPSRVELFEWLAKNCPNRVHVPLWAAHEYLRHFVQQTIQKDFESKIKEIESIARSTYGRFRPFMDEPTAIGQEDPAMARSTMRDTINKLQTLAVEIRKWGEAVPEHSTEVVKFINAHVPGSTGLYSYFHDIGMLAASRNVGSVPPGFQDRRKKGLANDVPAQSTADAPAESNRYGDLLFWKEVVDHATQESAQYIVVLTNDRKNDWYLNSGSSGSEGQIVQVFGKSAKPVPRAHPMLVAEARLAANVEDVVLLDNSYLGAVLQALDKDEVRAFSDVAIGSDDDPAPATLKAQRREAVSRSRNAPSTIAQPASGPTESIFSDGQLVEFGLGALARALYESRTNVVRSRELCDSLFPSNSDISSEQRSLTQAALEGLGHIELVSAARELHDRAVERIPGYQDSLVDLISSLSRLPMKTAGCFYLGLLASMYLSRETNSTLIPPRSPVAQQIFAQQNAPYAERSIDVLRKRIAACDKRPLYTPDVNRPAVLVLFEINPAGVMRDELNSLRLNGIEVLNLAQNDSTLNLTSLFGSAFGPDQATLALKASELFCLPESQLLPSESTVRYTLTETIGFKRPADAFHMTMSPVDQPY